MPRKLTGSVTRRGASWEVVVPVAKGARKRKTARFGSQQTAEAWRSDAVAAINAGKALPDPRDYRDSRSGGRPAHVRARLVPPSFADAAWSWHTEYYEHYRRAEAQRASEVASLLENHVIPWFAGYRVDEPVHACLECGNDYRQACSRSGQHRELKALALELAGRGEPSPGQAAAECATPGGEEVGVNEAARLCGVHRSSVKRWLRAGELADTRIDPANGRRMIPVASLHAAGKLGEVPAPTGYSRRYAGDILWVAHSVFQHSVRRGWRDDNPADGVTAQDPDRARARTQPDRERARPLTLAECRAVATHLNPLHQTVLWLLRLLGLRISEAFGPRVGDLLDNGETGLLVIGRQGGRPFLQRDDEGNIVTVHEVERTKTNQSYRILVVPASLMRLLRVHIAAYHTDPATGEVDLSARLIPGLQQPNTAGNGSFDSALQAALRAEGLSTEHMGFHVSSHLMRKSLATDLAYSNVDDLVQRRVLGHVAGPDVHARVYLLDTPEAASHREVAHRLDEQIEEEIGDLLVPTSKRPRFGKANPLSQRLDYIETVFAEAWAQECDDEPLLGTRELAELLGEPVTTVRRWMREERLPVVTATDGFGAQRRMVRQSDAQAFLAQNRQRRPLTVVAEELGVAYHQAWQMLRRLDITPHQLPSGEFRLDDEEVARLHAEVQRIAALHERAVRVADAADTLGVVPDTVYKMIRRGELEQDAEVDGAGARYVTRASLQAYVEHAGRPGQRANGARRVVADSAADVAAVDGADEGLIALSDLSELTGFNHHQLKALADARHLSVVTRARRTYATRESVERWAAGHRPELLGFLDGWTTAPAVPGNGPNGDDPVDASLQLGR